jgi:hypothetical protein
VNKRPPVEGSCLCGAVTIRVDRGPRSVTQCNCSVCRRYGTMWAYYKRARVAVKAARGTLVAFRRRPRGLRFMHCKTCGCVVTWENKRGADAYMAINARLLDQAAIADVPIKILDGDRTWKVLATYVRPEIYRTPTSPSRSRRRA